MGYGRSWAEKQDDIPKLPASNDRGAPLPKPQSGYVIVKVGEREDGTAIVALKKKPDY